MTRLPEKNVLDGSKSPKTTTSEMKKALGELRDYLHELLGEDGSDRESARQTLGIDLTTLNDRIDAKADTDTVTAVVADKADRSELDELTQGIREEIASTGAPVGTVAYFAMETPPAGYLKADGSAVGREMYPDLFSAIGTTYGEGDGSTTFNLPDLMGRFAQGSVTPGILKQAGLPNITGSISNPLRSSTFSFGGEWGISVDTGALSSKPLVTNKAIAENDWTNGCVLDSIHFNAAQSNAIYGASDTVQPPALTLLPCIKAFGAIADNALIDVSVLAQEMARKVDKTVNGKKVAYVVDSWRSGAAYWRLWSDGWLEQGGLFGPIGIGSSGHLYETVNLLKPYTDTEFHVLLVTLGEPYATPATYLYNERTTTSIKVGGQDWAAGYGYWYTCGMTVPS